eukprot:gene9063-11514_t
MAQPDVRKKYDENGLTPALLSPADYVAFLKRDSVTWGDVVRKEMSSRLAVDIGGTFTDVVLETGTISHSIKILTTPDAPERAVLEGVRSILAEAKCRPQD